MLSYDIDWRGLADVADEIGGTEKQVQFALGRALRRTEASLRRIASKGLRQELQLRSVGALRKRLKTIKLRKTGGLGAGNGVGLWFGLNDMPVGVLKGRAKQTKAGAGFRSKEFAGAFIGKSKISGRRSIFKRDSAARLPIAEQLYPIQDQATVFIEDQVFDQVETIFWQHFRRDLAARVKFKLGGA